MPKPENDLKAPEALHGRRFYLGWRWAALLLLLAAGGALLGYWLSSRADERIARGVSVTGRSLGGLTAGEALALLRADLEPMARQPVTLVLEDKSWVVTPLAAGIVLDSQDIVGRAYRVGREGGLLHQVRERRAVSRAGKALPLTFRTEPALWSSFCQTLEGEVNQEPVSVHLSVDQAGGLTVSPGRNGRILDRKTLLGFLEQGFAAQDGRRHELPIVTAKPGLSEEDVANWPLDQVLGIYTSKFNPGDNQRSHNLKMAAAALDGMIIKPGEDFSFNEHVGPRVPEKGYLEAPVISRNRLVLGVGGGVCQVSGTLFNAALLAGLPIRQRYNHSQPSSYVPLGRDATVAYAVIDFVFGNDSGRPLVLATGVTGSRLTIALVGHRDVKPQVEVDVEVKQKIPFETVTENDPGLAAGAQAVTQAGRDGYKLQLWRRLSWPDKPMVREPIGAVSYYPPQKKVIKRGIGSPRFGVMTPPRPTEPVPPPALPPAGDPSGGSP